MNTISLSDRQARRAAPATVATGSATVTPMPFPRRRHEHEQQERAAAASRVQQAWQDDMATAERNGRDIGLAAGRRQGFVSGWYWGLVCGLVAAGFAAAGGAALLSLI